MPRLADYQSDFAEAMFGGKETVAAAVEERGIPASARLSIYRNNIFHSLTECLQATFPVVEKLVGEEFFRALAREYIKHNQPDGAALLAYGRTFPDFVSAFPPAQSVPYLADVARLELAWLDAYHAADDAPLKPDDLKSLPPQSMADLRLELHPSARLVRSQYPVGRIWAANQENAAQSRIRSDDGPDRLLVIRPRFDVMVRFLEEGTYAFISALAERRPLAEAFEQASAVDANFDLQKNLHDLIVGESFSAFAV